ncbi:MAG: cell wall-binding repeat-containing protein [Coriobacteriales bacterium]|jgi:uncharacterized protein YkwD/putative cell wall-binding protein|nr:cell wall-binding repeat-containing protein [Coriobacteriales bacterium]
MLPLSAVADDALVPERSGEKPDSIAGSVADSLVERVADAARSPQAVLSADRVASFLKGDYLIDSEGIADFEQGGASALPPLGTSVDVESGATGDVAALGSAVAGEVDIAASDAGSEDLLPLATTLANPSWQRLGGINRYETMQKIVREGWQDAEVAFLSTGEKFPDALAASCLAGLFDAPILLTESDTLNAFARQELIRLGVDTVFILGSTATLSENVEKQVQSLSPSGVQTLRIGGENRYQTAYLLYDLYDYIMAGFVEENYESAEYISRIAIVATGTKFPDALSIAPVAYATWSPIFLYDPYSGFDGQTLAALTSGRFDLILLIGGDDPATLPDAAIRSQLGAMGAADRCQRIAGSDRYLTSLAVANMALETDALGEVRGDVHVAPTISLAKGSDFPDALAGAALSGKLRAPLSLVADSPEGRVGIYRMVARNHYHGALETGYLLGSELSVSSDIETAVKTFGSPTNFEQRVVDLVNVERANNGVSPLQVRPILQGVADIRADELTQYFDHVRPNGLDCLTAFTRDLQGDELSLVNSGAGENIALGYPSPEAVVSAWMDSPGHRSNILNPSFTHIGVGHVVFDGRSYWVQFFGGI